jgi:DNA invertase Pin-like site-specific DNA recombinase
MIGIWVFANDKQIRLGQEPQYLIEPIRFSAALMFVGEVGKRPAFDALCRDAARREFDVVMAWSVDRLGRSLQDLVNFLSELHALKIDLFLKSQGIDTTTPSGKAMFGMLSVFADFERSMIQERVRAGLLRARREGKRLGRPPLAPAVKARIAAALTAKDRKEGVRKIAARFGVNPSTVQAISREQAARQ